MDYSFTINKRLFSELLSNYPSTFAAFCELLNNSLQAKATEIRIDLVASKIPALTGTTYDTITVADNGIGVPKREFGWKILQVATDSKDGGKGIGRFAALQIGSQMDIETVAYDATEKAFLRTEVSIDSSRWHDVKTLENVKLDVRHTPVEGKDSSYRVTIRNLYPPEVVKHEKRKRLAKEFEPGTFETAIFTAYAETVFTQKTKFFINQKWLDPNSFVIGDVEVVEKDFVALDGTQSKISYRFMLVNMTEGTHQVFLRVDNAGLRSVAQSFHYTADIPEKHRWFIFVDSPFFDEHTDVLRNFWLSKLDPSAEHLHNSIKEDVDTFFAEKYEQYRSFLEKLKADSAYPYRDKPPSSDARHAVFNQVAYHLEVEHQLLAKKNALRSLVYGLLDRALNQGDFEELLSTIIRIDETTLGRFKAVLARADVEDVIEFCENVSRKSEVLDCLHRLVYGELSKHVMERSQLHKYVERHLWLFGEHYNGTPKLYSDKNLLNNLEALRNEYLGYEPSSKDENLIEIEDTHVKNITDLFFFNEKILDDTQREVMIVELKKPTVKIHRKEIDQAKYYAFQISERAVFPDGLTYRIILVSSDMSAFAKSQLGQIDAKNPYLIHRSKPPKIVEVWAIRWSDLIDANRKKLSYLGNLLKIKDRNATEIVEKEFEGIPLQKLKSVLDGAETDGFDSKKRKRKKVVEVT